MLAKVLATLPSVGQQRLTHAVSKVHRFKARYPPFPHLRCLREACWEEVELVIDYEDETGRSSRRTVRPLAIVYVDHALVLMAWFHSTGVLTDGARWRQSPVRATETASAGPTDHQK